jgi:hypothetical protein
MGVRIFKILFIAAVLGWLKSRAQTVTKTPNSTFAAWSYGQSAVHTQGIIGPVSGVSAIYTSTILMVPIYCQDIAYRNFCWLALY